MTATMMMTSLFAGQSLEAQQSDNTAWFGWLLWLITVGVSQSRAQSYDFHFSNFSQFYIFFSFWTLLNVPV
jgi:hypothetical protein